MIKIRQIRVTLNLTKIELIPTYKRVGYETYFNWFGFDLYLVTNKKKLVK